MITFRDYLFKKSTLKLFFVIITAAMVAGVISCSSEKKVKQPNIILVLTDDQGYGDLACHGNPYIRTPQLDKLHDEAIRLTDFHVAPMCAPTRGQLMTGIDCLRNGAMATCLGRASVREQYPMIGEIFSSVGYHTGLFGKWHLGYNWPHRPMDRGFQTAKYFMGFGLTGMGHYWNTDYFDPYYYDSEELKQAKGYCNDFWFNEAINWMKESSKKESPFMCFITTNLPHFPEWVDEKYSSEYGDMDIANFYGMIANVDENMGKLDSFLTESGLKNNTIFIYLTDNGSVHSRTYNAGMTGGKTARTEGGHRVPCFIRWPDGNLVEPSDIKTPTQVQDLLPTLIDFCKINTPPDLSFDGKSLAGLLKGEDFCDRMFVVQYYQNSLKKWDAAVVWNQWRLLYGDQLYDIRADLEQKNNIAESNPEIVEKMKIHYENWWIGVEPRLDDFVCNHIGSSHQDEVMLCSSDWQDVRADGQASARRPRENSIKGGVWNLEVEKTGTYNIELRRWPKEADTPLSEGLPSFVPRFGKPEPEGVAIPISAAHLKVDERKLDRKTTASDKFAAFTVEMEKGKSKLQGWFTNEKNEPVCGAFYAYVSLVE